MITDVIEDIAANSEKTVIGRAFKPGQSGNPSGRPKGFNHLIRDETDDGKELVLLAIKIMRGKMSVRGFGGMKFRPSVRERLEALKWLADRGWGKAVESIDVKQDMTVSISIGRQAPKLVEGELIK